MESAARGGGPRERRGRARDRVGGAPVRCARYRPVPSRPPPPLSPPRLARSALATASPSLPVGAWGGACAPGCPPLHTHSRPLRWRQSPRPQHRCRTHLPSPLVSCNTASVCRHLNSPRRRYIKALKSWGAHSFFASSLEVWEVLPSPTHPSVGPQGCTGQGI
jgi:hypothetical protein